MDIIRDTEQEINFDESSLPRILPGLGRCDFGLSIEQLKQIFDVDETQIAPIPSRLVVPALKGQRRDERWLRTYGWLYVLEPHEWVPVVRHGGASEVKHFRPEYSIKRKDMPEANFTDGCKAGIVLPAGGSYYEVTSTSKDGRSTRFEYSSTTLTSEDFIRLGLPGNEIVEELLLFPILRCKVIKRQRIDYTINTSTDEIEWGEKSSDPEYLERMRVPSSRLRGIAELQAHPVPVDVDDEGKRTCILPVPQISSNGDFEITTLLSRTGSLDWYIYDAEFQDYSKTVDLVAPDNGVTFRPTSSWIMFADYTFTPTPRNNTISARKLPYLAHASGSGSGSGSGSAGIGGRQNLSEDSDDESSIEGRCLLVASDLSRAWLD